MRLTNVGLLKQPHRTDSSKEDIPSDPPDLYETAVEILVNGRCGIVQKGNVYVPTLKLLRTAPYRIVMSRLVYQPSALKFEAV